MSGFEEYIEWRVKEGCFLQSSFFCDEDGRFIVDYLGRLENIRSDFQRVCDHIGVDAELPHENESSHANYRKYYNNRTRELVAERFC